MLFLLIFICLAVGLCYWACTDDWDTAPVGIAAIIFAVMLVFVLAAWPFIYQGVSATIAEVEAIQETVDNARVTGNNFENVAMQQEIIKLNRKLANAKSYNNVWFGCFVPNKIDNVKLIK